MQNLVNLMSKSKYDVFQTEDQIRNK